MKRKRTTKSSKSKFNYISLLVLILVFLMIFNVGVVFSQTSVSVAVGEEVTIHTSSGSRIPRITSSPSSSIATLDIRGKSVFATGVGLGGPETVTIRESKSTNIFTYSITVTGTALTDTGTQTQDQQKSLTPTTPTVPNADGSGVTTLTGYGTIRIKADPQDNWKLYDFNLESTSENCEVKVTDEISGLPGIFGSPTTKQYTGTNGGLIRHKGSGDLCGGIRPNSCGNPDMREITERDFGSAFKDGCGDCSLLQDSSSKTYRPKGDLLCADNKWYLCETPNAFIQFQVDGDDKAYRCNDQNEWVPVEVCGNGKDDTEKNPDDTNVDCADDECYGKDKSKISINDPSLIGEHDLDFTSEKVYYHPTCNPDTDDQKPNGLTNAMSICEKTITFGFPERVKSYDYASNPPLALTNKNQCCGDDLSDCQKVEKVDATKSLLCTVDAAQRENSFSKWLKSEVPPDSNTGEGIGNIKLVPCSGTEFLSTGSNWVQCLNGNFVELGTNKVTVDGHQYACIGSGFESIVECCGDDVSNCNSNANGKKATIQDIINPATVSLTCNNGDLDTGEQCDGTSVPCTNGGTCNNQCQCVSDTGSCTSPQLTCFGGCITPICSDNDDCDQSSQERCTNPGTCNARCTSSARVCNNDNNKDSWENCDGTDNGICTSLQVCNSQCFCTPKSSTCGDGTKDSNEACDDGNTNNGDGCNQNCQIEPGAPIPTGGTRQGGCESVTEAAFLAIVQGNHPPTNAGIQQAIPDLRSAFGSQVVIITHPERLDKIDFGGGMVVDVIIGAGGPSPSWGWIVEMQCGSGSSGVNCPTSGGAPPQDRNWYCMSDFTFRIGSISNNVEQPTTCPCTNPPCNGPTVPPGPHDDDSGGGDEEGTAERTCIAAGFAWTGTQCCGEPDDRPEYYNENKRDATFLQGSSDERGSGQSSSSGSEGGGSAPNREDIIIALNNEQPGLIDDCHAFTNEAACRLNAIDSNFGRNGKRGDRSDLSEDAISYRGTNGPGGVDIIDIIGSCGDNPGPQWLDQTQATLDAGTVGAWVAPSGCSSSGANSNVIAVDSITARALADITGNQVGISDSSSSSLSLGSGERLSSNSGLGGCWYSQAVYSIGFVPETKNSVINYDGQFHGCVIDKSNYNSNNDKLLEIRDSHTEQQLVENHEYCFVEREGQYFCDYTERWEPTNGQDRSHFTLSPLKDAAQAGGCCAESDCWDGVSCIANQKDNPLETPLGDGFRCIDGEWEKGVRKCSPDGIECGYCNYQSQCLLEIATNGSLTCIDSQEYGLDNLCENGEWTSRTKFLALNLLSMKAGDYTLFCDNKENTLNNLNYFSTSSSSVQSVLQSIETNNFCVIETSNKIIAAATLNKDPTAVQGGINIFGVSNCDSAQNDGNYHKCDQSSRVWYNPSLNSFIFSSGPINVPTSQVSSNFISSLVTAITDAIKRLISNPPIDESYLDSTKMLSRLYLNQKGNSAIRGSIEGDIQNNLVIEYNSIDTDVCSILDGSSVGSTFTSSGIECRKEGNNYYVLGQGSKFTTIDPDKVWADLTSKLRLN
jgi:cysteine-rich repeat protein